MAAEFALAAGNGMLGALFDDAGGLYSVFNNLPGGLFDITGKYRDDPVHAGNDQQRAECEFDVLPHDETPLAEYVPLRRISGLILGETGT